jgi:hypothetical protein
MKIDTAPFTIKPFKNRNGTISFRVAGWLPGGRIRKNFKSREGAIVERGLPQPFTHLPPFAMTPGGAHSAPYLPAMP